MITVKDLLKACQEQVDKGNGDKGILISRDDEGNGYHSLFYLFSNCECRIKLTIIYQLVIIHF